MKHDWYVIDLFKFVLQFENNVQFKYVHCLNKTQTLHILTFF